MFCNKCGKELPDGAAFCTGCGNQIGAAPQNSAPAAAPAEMPLIIKRLVSQVVAFFVKKDPAGVVCNSARDNTWSGLILGLFGILMSALGVMVYVNQVILSAFKDVSGGAFNSAVTKFVSKLFPSGTTFGMTLLASAVVFVVASVLLFILSNYLAKKPLSIQGAFNVVAYASIPMIAVAILNMLFGLIWTVLPLVFTILAVVATVVLLFIALNKVVGFEKPALWVNYIFLAAVTIVTVLFAYIVLKESVNALISKVMSGMGGALDFEDILGGLF